MEVIPDSDPARPASDLTRASSPVGVESRPKARVTYGRKAVPDDDDDEEDEVEGALGQSSEVNTLARDASVRPSPPPRAAKRVSPIPSPLPPSDDEDAGGAGYDFEWKRQLAALDASSDDEEGGPVNDENAPPSPPLPRTYARRKPLDEIHTFSSSLPTLTSSEPDVPIVERKSGLSLFRARSPDADGDGDGEKSSPVSEEQSGLFEFDSPFSRMGGETPESSPVKEQVSAGKGREGEQPLFLAEDGDDDELPAQPLSSAPKPSTADKLRDLALQRAAARPPSPPSPAPALDALETLFSDDEDKPDSKTKKKRSRSRRAGSDADLSGPEARKKPKKLSKKALEETHRETARLLAAQNTSIPRYENRLTLGELMGKFQVNAALTQPSQSESKQEGQLRKLPRPSKPLHVHHSLADDPIVDASSSPRVPSSSAPRTSTPGPSQPAFPPLSQPAPAPKPKLNPNPFPMNLDMEDSDDELPESIDAILEQEKAKKEAEAKKAEEERRRLAKLAILEARNKRSMVPASALLAGAGSGEEDSELEIDDGGKVGKGKGKTFMGKLVSASRSRSHHHPTRAAPIPIPIPTDSQVSRAARPSFSSPPSARKTHVSRDALNRKLLRKAEERAEEEVRRKEEEWVRRGGRRREVRGGGGVGLGEVLRRAVERGAEEEREEEDGEEEDGDWAPQEEASGSDEDKPMEDAALDLADPEQEEEEEEEAASPDSNKENEAGANKENEAPTPSPSRVRTVLSEMKLDSSTEEPDASGDADDEEEEEPFRPRKKRKLGNGNGLRLDDEEEEEEREMVPRRLFQDSEEEEDGMPKAIVGLGAAFDDEEDGMDVFGAPGGGDGGLSQFFAESQAAGRALSQLRNAAMDELKALSPTKLMPSIRLSTQQRILQDEVFAEDQEARRLDAVKAANEKLRGGSTPGGESRIAMSPSFLADEFTQRMDQDTSSEFQFDVGDAKSVAETLMDIESQTQSEVPMDELEPSSPVAGPGRLTRLRRHESPVPSSGYGSDSDRESTMPGGELDKENNVPTPTPALNAFDVMKRAQLRADRREEKRRLRSAFVEGEAEEEEDDLMIGFGMRNKDDDEEDEDEDNGVLEELVDDQAMDAKTVAADKVLEKHLEHQAADDAMIEKKAKDIAEGKVRLRKPDNLLSDDEDDEDERRRYHAPIYGRRKDGAADLEALAKNPATVSFYRSYESTHTPVEDGLFDHLQPPVEGEPGFDKENQMDEDSQSEEDDEDDEDVIPANVDDEEAPKPKVVGFQELQRELREAAKNKDSIVPLRDPNDVSWVDVDGSDDDTSGRKYKEVKTIRRTKPIQAAIPDDMMLTTGPSRKIDSKQQAKLVKAAKEDSNRFSTSAGGGAVTGFTKQKPQAKDAQKGKAAKAPVQRPSAHPLFGKRS